MSTMNYINSRRLVLVLMIIMPTTAFAENETMTLIEQYRQGVEHWPEAKLDAGVEVQPLMPLPQQIEFPLDNPFSEEKQQLGKHLFFDRRLSQSQQIACASCHDPDLAWADGRRKAIGHNRIQGDINSPSIVDTGFLKQLFWDGRVNSLEEQTLASWTNPIEMAANPENAAKRLAKTASYPALFKTAFGDENITPERIVQAIATFVRTVRSSPSDFDRFMEGKQTALTDQQIRGLHLFRTKARCIHCHNGPLLSDNQFHHLGTSFDQVGNFQGRYKMTGKAEDVGAFRTPALRTGIASPPYMHNGLVTDLDMLLAMYNMGWWQNAKLDDKTDDIPTAQLSPLIKPLDLSKQELADLKAFLLGLSSHLPQPLLPEELP